MKQVPVTPTEFIDAFSDAFDAWKQKGVNW
jgi:hypothetical protein